MALKIKFQPLSADSLRATLDEFEQRYGVPSERLRDVFRDAEGHLQENADFLDWSHAYTAWRQINKA